MTKGRTFLKTHPWLKFETPMEKAPSELWILLGEAQSKCEHIAGVPLRPDIAKELNKIYLAKGVRATTAIEGNTLSEEEVRKQVEGELEVPPSKEYLKQEVKNIVDACNEIIGQILAGSLQPITTDQIKQYNAKVLNNLDRDDHVTPGELTQVQVGVGSYRGAPPRDLDYLMGKLCEWLNGDHFNDPTGKYGIIHGLLRAVMAHLYIAWIHPFGDGNGRTARLIEFRFLLEAGAPTPATHLLSDHYNNTRTEYYRQLDRANRSGGNVIPFIQYAVRGFVDGLREQVKLIKFQQFDVSWRNYVHECMKDYGTKTGMRRRHLVLDLSSRNDPVPISEIRTLSPRLSKEYSRRTDITISRDVKWLIDHDLIKDTPKGILSNRGLILAFLPARRTEDISGDSSKS